MRRWIFGLALSALAGSAMAGPACTKEPREKWLSESDMKAKIATLGVVFKIFKVTEGNCYEIYGRDSGGKRVEIYFNPVTGAIVEDHKS